MNFKSKTFRVRDRVPVHRLFVKIFSWFWVTALVIIGIIFIGRRVMDLRPIDPSTMYASVASMVATQAAQAYESGGPAGFLVLPTTSPEVTRVSFSCSMNSTRMYSRDRSRGMPSDWRERPARISLSQRRVRCTNVSPRINLLLLPDVHTRWCSTSTLGCRI